MRKVTLFIALLLIFVFAFPTFVFAENPRSYESINVKIMQSGSFSLSDIAELNLSIFIPQENIESIYVFTDGGEWKYIYDNFGNKKILMEWKNPKNVIKYKIETIVENNAEHLYSEEQIGFNPDYVRETDYILINDEIKRIAYPFEKSLKKAFELTEWVHNYMTYDLSYKGKNMTSIDVLLERKGVCSAYATLLAALLRANNIPTRYVVGYAYSDVQKKFIPHAWVEILLSDGSWAQLDPTWLQSGYVDATHIRTGSMLDAVSATEISYTKTSKNSYLDWTENDDEFEIIDYKISSPISLELDAKRSIFSNAYGFVKATIDSNDCLISEIAAKSCINARNEPVFEIFDKNRTTWGCGSYDIYFFFKPIDKERYSYLCTITVFDQTGSEDSINITVYEKGKIDDIYISGPELVKINENFQLIAITENDFIFYSNEFGKHNDSVWDLSINRQGTYKFYLYSDGALATKNVNVVEQKEFDLSVSLPKNVTSGGSFIAVVDAKNLLNNEKTATIIVEFDEQKIERTITFAGNEIKNIEFNLTAKELGQRTVSVSVLSDSLTSYSSSIYVYEIKKKSWVDDIIDFFSKIMKWFSELF